MRYLFLFCLFVFSLASCTPKPIKINVDSAPSKLVVFSHAIPNNAMIISLTKSFSLLDGIDEDQYADLLVSGAVVKVTVDGIVYDFFELTNGFYTSFDPLIANATHLELTVSHQNDFITAKTSTLAPVFFTEFQPIVEKNASDTIVHLQIGFADLPNERNYYMINVYRQNDDVSLFDGVNFFDNGSNVLVETILISDLEFGASYSKKHTFNDLLFDDSIAVSLSNISESYFNFLVLRNQGGSFINQLNLEPLNFPTNVINGYGFFNAHIPDVRFDDLGQY